MDMLIDGSWTGASDGAVDAVLNPATGEEIATVPRASGRRRRPRRRRGAGRGRRGWPRCRRTAASRSSRRWRGGSRRTRRRSGVLLCRENGKRIGETTSEVGVAARIFRGYAEEAKRVFGRIVPARLHPGPRAVAGGHHAAAARRDRRHRAVQLPGRALEPQGRRRARRRQRGDHQDAGGLSARGDRDQPLPRGGGPAARRAPGGDRRPRTPARRWSRPKACRWSP